MARTPASQSKRNQSNSRGTSSQAKRKAGARKQPVQNDSRILDDHTRQNIWGVVFIVLGVVLLVLAFMPQDAIVTAFLSQALHLTFGIGAYLLPLFAIAIGVVLMLSFEKQYLPVRVAIGLVMIFVALLAEFSLFTPLADPKDLTPLFTEEALVSHGGYIGGAFAWLGLMFLGQTVSCITMAGAILVALVIIGFSVSKVIEKVRAMKEAAEASADSLAAPPFARVRRQNSEVAVDPNSPVRPVHPMASAPTGVLPRGGNVRPRPQRASQPLSSRAMETQVLEQNDTYEEPAPLTRKLGRKYAEESPKTEVLPKKKGSLKTNSIVGTPRPQDGFELPPMSLLAVSPKKTKGAANSEEELQETAALLQETLEDFNIMAEVVGWVAGPTVTLFKVDLPAGVRVSRITALEDDIALALAAPGVRIFAPIPGTNYVGIEVPNRKRETVFLGDVLKNAKPGPLMVAIGEDVEGNSIIADLAKMPHLLIGGTTGSGKSVSINGMIMSILMRATPSEVRFIMIDPKRVEFTPYNGIPHLYVPVVTESKEAASALSWAVAEMERRLKVYSKVGARNINQYNAKVQEALNAAEAAQSAGEEPPENELAEASQMPYIVIVIDELADLMMNVGKEVEFSISRLAQLARAAGIHLIVATQRPSTNVVTGLIKANITNRIAFNVASGIDSRVILDTPGAENLIGLGDMLFSKPEYAKPQRIQGCYVSEDEINAVVSLLKEQGEPEYHTEILKTNLITLGASSPDGSDGGLDDDPLLWEAADIVVSSGLGSTSNIQRRLKVGYSRAGRIMDMLENKGIVGPPNGSKPREVLVDAMELETLKAFEANDMAENA